MSLTTSNLSRRDFFLRSFRSAGNEFLSSIESPTIPTIRSNIAASAVGGTPTNEVRNRFPDCVVTTHREVKRRFFSDLVANQRIVLGLIYTNCERICPVTTSNMIETYKILKARNTTPFRMITLTVDPERDTPDHLLRYAARHEIAGLDDWDFITASPEDTLAIRRSFKLADNVDPTKANDIKSHSGLLVLGNDQKGRWSAIPSGADPSQIANTFERIARNTSLRGFVGRS